MSPSLSHAQSSVRGRARVLLALLPLAAPACGRTDRHGVAYEGRRAQLKRIAIIPASVEVKTMHADESLERRPDLIAQVLDRSLDYLAAELRTRGAEPVPLKGPIPPPAGHGVPEPSLAKLHAVKQDILEKHYVQGDARVFNYSLGDLCVPTAAAHNADAILWFFITGDVPTEGRKAVKAATITGGVLTTTPMYAHADRAVLLLLLADGESGDVLWFNRYPGTEDIAEPDDLHDLIHDACRNLLLPATD